MKHVVLPAAVVSLFIAATYGLLGYMVKLDHDHQLAQQQWFRLHECRRAGYIYGGAMRAPRSVFVCNDGQQYLWEDLPEVRQ